jgi:hypothetical protein
MAYETRDNSGTLFRNERKEQPNHADYQGECMIDGQMYYMNAWLKEGKNGKFMSFSFRPKAAGSKPKEARKVAAMDDDSSIPF